MRASVAVQAALMLPIVAAVFALLLEGGTGSRSMPVLGLVLAAAGAGTAGVLAALGRDVAWQSFDADAWRGLLAAGALLTSAAGVARAVPFARGATAVGAGTAAASIFAPDLLAVGVLLVASTAAWAVVSYVGRLDRRAALRSIVPLIVSDALAVAAFSSAAGRSLAFEPLGDVPGALLLAAAVIRLAPAPAWIEDAARGGTFAAWLGPVRAQGALLALLAVAGSSGRATALMIAGAVVAVVAALRLLRDPEIAVLLVAPGAIAAVGIGFGGGVALAGAAVALAASFAAAVLAHARPRSIGAPLMGFAPACASLLGFSLIGGAVWRVAATRAEYLPVALALAAVAGLSAVAAWRIPDDNPIEAVEPSSDAGTTGVDGAEPDSNVGSTGSEEIVHAAPRRSWAFAFVAIPALLVAAAPAFAPAFIFDRGAVAVASAAGAGPALVPSAEAFPEGLGVAIAALTLVGLVAGGGANVAQQRLATPVTAPRWMRGWASAVPLPVEGAPSGTRPITIVAFAAAATVAVLTIRLVLVAGGRGWL